MIRALAIALALGISPALAQALPPPEVAALGQMLAEAQQREAMALIRAVRAERRAAELEAKSVPSPPPNSPVK